MSAFRHSGCQATSKSFVKIIGKVTAQVRRAIETSEEEGRGWGRGLLFSWMCLRKEVEGAVVRWTETLGGRESGNHVDGSRKA